MFSALAVILGQTLLKWQESQQQLQAYQSHSSIKIPETRTWLKTPRTTPELGSLWPGGWNVPIGQTLVTWLSLEPIRSQLPEPCGLTVGERWFPEIHLGCVPRKRRTSHQADKNSRSHLNWSQINNPSSLFTLP